MVHSAKHSPVVTEYSVSGTTYAPEGIIFDSSEMQVNIILTSDHCFIAQAKHTFQFTEPVKLLT